MKHKEKIEFRYYEIPQGVPLIALTGKRWEIPYGTDAMHFHNYMEIGICRYGKGTMYFGKDEVPYQDGTITVIPKEFPHHTLGIYGEVQKWEFLFIDVDSFIQHAFSSKPQYIDQILRRLNRRMFSLASEDHPDISMAVNLLLDEAENQREFYKESLSGILLGLLMKLLRLNAEEESKIKTVILGTNFDRIAEVLHYINVNFKEKLRIGDLAKQCSMSETHFRRVFTEYMNASPMDYINTVRIKKACEMLRKSDGKVENIAAQVGFPIATTFSRNFKKVTGYTPTDYRTMIKKQENVFVDYKISVLKGW
ncbi:MAG TPA: helix-turn-helix transcriptional regulator [Candidatus Merdenecus merdavium]|nr:helix-turn-helix transcriptional regulator [Candidatus Merdenecus merdavium]